MKVVFRLIIIIVIIIGSMFIDSCNVSQQNNQNRFTIVIHGGAGYSQAMEDSIKEDYLNSIATALKIGKKILGEGGTSLDAVESVVKFLEDDPKFNAGKGATYTSAGTHELDASIMCGKDLSNGAVTLIKSVKNPISLARLVMEKSPHVLLGGEGAEEFAKQMKVEMVPNSYFDTIERSEKDKNIKNKKGTVGCVALDKFGNLAAATSTGGRYNKMPGRIGDSPLVNAGTYANNKTCAVSCTGIGELFITHTVAFNISALMEYKGLSLKEAADQMINKTLKPGDGGIIAVDKDGNYVTMFNTKGMCRGVANSEGVFETKIWE
jgi:L-asparaginase / beta-aspartyl-peptidase